MVLLGPRILFLGAQKEKKKRSDQKKSLEVHEECEVETFTVDNDNVISRFSKTIEISIYLLLKRRNEKETCVNSHDIFKKKICEEVSW